MLHHTMNMYGYFECMQQVVFKRKKETKEVWALIRKKGEKKRKGKEVI
jgi:hypothetical protein